MQPAPGLFICNWDLVKTGWLNAFGENAPQLQQVSSIRLADMIFTINCIGFK